MESEQIKQLLDRYWQAETSVEEEALLRDWLTENDVTEVSKLDSNWFAFLVQEQDMKLGDDFDARVLAQAEVPVVKARKMSLLARFMPLFKAAAAVVLFVWLGYVAQHPFDNESVEIASIDTIGKQISTPSVALSNDATLKREQCLDSLKQE